MDPEGCTVFFSAIVAARRPLPQELVPVIDHLVRPAEEVQVVGAEEGLEHVGAEGAQEAPIVEQRVPSQGAGVRAHQNMAGKAVESSRHLLQRVLKHDLLSRAIQEAARSRRRP
jgi:hypothetical protein